MNKDIAKEASKGGKAILEKYGRDYFSKLGKKGRKKQSKKK